MTDDLKLHPLWAEEYWKIKAFFEKDPTIVVGEVEKINGVHVCTISTEDSKKARYLASLIKTAELDVIVEDGTSNNEKMAYLCKDNPIFHDFIKAEDPDTGIIKYEAIEFEPVCLHYFSDDMFSSTGHTAILPFQLARDLFKGNRINFQTHLED